MRLRVRVLAWSCGPSRARAAKASGRTLPNSAALLLVICIPKVTLDLEERVVAFVDSQELVSQVPKLDYDCVAVCEWLVVSATLLECLAKVDLGGQDTF